MRMNPDTSSPSKYFLCDSFVDSVGHRNWFVHLLFHLCALEEAASTTTIHGEDSREDKDLIQNH